MREPVHVTRTFMPPLAEVHELLEGIWSRGQLTNNGPLLLELEQRLKAHLGLDHLIVVGNGTIALQLAIRALDLHGEVITTPYSYAASTTSILWERCTPVHVDIDPVTFCIDPQQVEAAITPRTTGILATHVYGLPCDTDALEDIARRHGLKVIYDGAHAFGSNWKGRSLLHYGDVSTLSCHATKVFHSAEGGTVTARDPEVQRRLFLMRSFGHVKDDHFMLGINGKNSELHAAIGLVVLRYMATILDGRRTQWRRYQALLHDAPVQLASIPEGLDHNHSYFPVVLPTGALPRVMQALSAVNIFPRRYFFPALSELPYLDKRGTCPIARDIAERVICLPLFHGLDPATQDEVVHVLRGAL
jgi:dTDP-4-amino-4,6-dideoxygalactose transaminase